jgi:hypothetical protein
MKRLDTPVVAVEVASAVAVHARNEARGGVPHGLQQTINVNMVFSITTSNVQSDLCNIVCAFVLPRLKPSPGPPRTRTCPPPPSTRNEEHFTSATTIPSNTAWQAEPPRCNFCPCTILQREREREREYSRRRSRGPSPGRRTRREGCGRRGRGGAM